MTTIRKDQYRTTIEVNGIEDVLATVHFEYTPFRAGSTDGRHGPKLEPDEPAHIEIDWIELPDGSAIDLTTKAETKMEEEIGNWLAEQEATLCEGPY